MLLVSVLMDVLGRFFKKSVSGVKEAKVEPLAEVVNWSALVADFQKPDTGKAVLQLLNSVGLYFLLWYVMYLTVAISWWLTIPVALLAGAVLVRIFIIFHDCCHGSFFKSKRLNHVFGFLAGLLTFTPYQKWRWEHSLHHATSGDLDRRGFGDVWTLTVEEYLKLPWLKKVAYRTYRNPLFLFFIAPVFYFLFKQRIPASYAKKRENRSIWLMNICVVAYACGMALVFGWVPWMIIQLIVSFVACSAGVWLFYVQHQFEDGYWKRKDDWSYTDAAIQGSSFYDLPRWMHWFSGNIGYHHIHHLSPKIPNYNLARCHYSNPAFSRVKTITLRSSLSAIRLRLWDEERGKFIRFDQLMPLSFKNR